MRGLLCSYPLNTEKVADMLTGKSSPHKLDLPSLIAILYIGAGKLPDESLKHLLHVFGMRKFEVHWFGSNKIT